MTIGNALEHVYNMVGGSVANDVANGTPSSSQDILDAITQAQRQMTWFENEAERIDRIYSARLANTAVLQDADWGDQYYDAFWASMEVLKPSIFARTPQVVVKPRYSDATNADKTAAELLERVLNYEFERGNVHASLREVRDDMALQNRGAVWLAYETEGGKRVCIDHVDRLDFVHEPARYWYEVSWVARRAWLTQAEMKARFSRASGDAYTRASYVSHRSDLDDGARDPAMKAAVWEFVSKPDSKVYWVTEGVDRTLDESGLLFDARDGFPCPRPAYGTVRRRTLVPIPDHVRYRGILEQINEVTGRIYTLLSQVRLVGLIPAGGDVGETLGTALAENTDAMFVPVPSAAMGQGGDYVQWVPLDVVATAITGLISARAQLFADFDRLSGISDIMRGETEAQETLGAQRIKTQYGSIRVRDKTEEIARVARDAARIAGAIVCDKYDQKTLLDIAQMAIPSKADVAKDIANLEKAARTEIKALGDQVQQAMAQMRMQQQVPPPGAPPPAQPGMGQVVPAAPPQMPGGPPAGGMPGAPQPPDTNAIRAQFQQAQQAIADKYAPQFTDLEATVVIEDVMAVLRDAGERGMVIDIETDSTVMLDEVAEKQASNEMMQAFSGGVTAMMPLFQTGDAGVKLAMAILNVAMDPFTGDNRDIKAAMDDLIQQAPQIAAKMSADKGQDGAQANQQGLVQAQQTLAQAEVLKAQAAMAKVQADAALAQASNQQAMADLQGKLQVEGDKHSRELQAVQAKSQEAMGKLQVQVGSQQQDGQKMLAEIDLIRAQTAQILASIGLDVREQDLDAYTAASAAQDAEFQRLHSVAKLAVDAAKPPPTPPGAGNSQGNQAGNPTGATPNQGEN